MRVSSGITSGSILSKEGERHSTSVCLSVHGFCYFDLLLAPSHFLLIFLPFLIKHHSFFLVSVRRRHLGGRHAAVVPALPEDSDNGNGSTYGYPPERVGPEQDPPRQLQIIQMENEGAQQRLPTTMKPITFHQEYAPQPPAPSSDRQLRERRNSRSSTSAHEEYRVLQAARPGSPAQNYRHASHSPAMMREPYSPQHHPSAPGGPSAHTRSHSRSSQDLRSPYQGHAVSPHHNGAEPGPALPRSYGAATHTPPPVPAPFASIMNAYPAPPMASTPEQEYPYLNGGRRNGSQSDRYAERADR